MISLLADIAQAASNTIDMEGLGQLLAILIGGGIIGGGAYKIGQKSASPVDVTNNPLNVRKADEYATKEDIVRIDKELTSIRQLCRDSETRAHERMDDMAKTLNRIEGITECIRDGLNLKSTTKK